MPSAERSRRVNCRPVLHSHIIGVTLESHQVELTLHALQGRAPIATATLSAIQVKMADAVSVSLICSCEHTSDLQYCG